MIFLTSNSGDHFTMPFVGIRIILVLILPFAVSKPKEILSFSTGDQYLHFSATPCGVFIIFSSCFVWFFLWCGFSPRLLWFF